MWAKKHLGLLAPVDITWDREEPFPPSLPEFLTVGLLRHDKIVPVLSYQVTGNERGAQSSEPVGHWRHILFLGHQEVFTDRGVWGQAWRQEKGSKASSSPFFPPHGQAHPERGLPPSDSRAHKANVFPQRGILLQIPNQ